MTTNKNKNINEILKLIKNNPNIKNLKDFDINVIDVEKLKEELSDKQIKEKNFQEIINDYSIENNKSVINISSNEINNSNKSENLEKPKRTRRRKVDIEEDKITRQNSIQEIEKEKKPVRRRKKDNIETTSNTEINNLPENIKTSKTIINENEELNKIKTETPIKPKRIRRTKKELELMHNGIMHNDIKLEKLNLEKKKEELKVEEKPAKKTRVYKKKQPFGEKDLGTENLNNSEEDNKIFLEDKVVNDIILPMRGENKTLPNNNKDIILENNLNDNEEINIEENLEEPVLSNLNESDESTITEFDESNIDEINLKFEKGEELTYDEKIKLIQKNYKTWDTMVLKLFGGKANGIMDNPIIHEEELKRLEEIRTNYTLLKTLNERYEFMRENIHLFPKRKKLLPFQVPTKRQQQARLKEKKESLTSKMKRVRQTSFFDDQKLVRDAYDLRLFTSKREVPKVKRLPIPDIKKHKQSKFSYPVNKLKALNINRFEEEFNDKFLTRRPKIEKAPTYNRACYVYDIDDSFVYVCGVKHINHLQYILFENGSLGTALDLKGYMDSDNNIENYLVRVIILEGDLEIPKGTLAWLEYGVCCIRLGTALLGRMITPTGYLIDTSLPDRTKFVYGLTPQRLIQPTPDPSNFQSNKNRRQLATGSIIIDTLFPFCYGEVHTYCGSDPIMMREVLNYFLRRTAIKQDKKDLDKTPKLNLNETYDYNEIKNKQPIFIYCLPYTNDEELNDIIGSVSENIGIGMNAHNIIIANSLPGRGIKPLKFRFTKYRIDRLHKKPDQSISYISLYSAFTAAEFYALNGENVIVIIDTLSDHLKGYTYLLDKFQLQTKGPLFEQHLNEYYSKFIKKCGVYSSDLGGGSLSAIFTVKTNPIEKQITKQEDIYEYPTINIERPFFEEKPEDQDLSEPLPKILMQKSNSFLVFSKNLHYNFCRPSINLKQSIRVTEKLYQNKYLSYYVDKCIHLLEHYNYFSTDSELQRLLQGDSKINNHLKTDKNINNLESIKVRKLLFYNFFRQQRSRVYDIHEQVFFLFGLWHGYLDNLDLVKESFLFKGISCEFLKYKTDYKNIIFKEETHIEKVKEMLIDLYDRFISLKRIQSLIRTKDVHQLEN